MGKEEILIHYRKENHSFLGSCDSILQGYMLGISGMLLSVCIMLLYNKAVGEDTMAIGIVMLTYVCCNQIGIYRFTRKKWQLALTILLVLFLLANLGYHICKTQG